MSKTEVIAGIDNLAEEEQKEVFAFLVRKILAKRDEATKPWLGKKLSFEEACDVIFRENHDLLSLLAK